jgi:hypothetical protein
VSETREYKPTGEVGAGAVPAWLELVHQLQRAADDGRPVPCRADPWPYTSDDREDRIEAAAACAPCPALIECARFALVNAERWYVWGGVDLSPHQGVVRSKALGLLAAIADEDVAPRRSRAAPKPRVPTHSPDPALVEFFATTAIDRGGRVESSADKPQDRRSLPRLSPELVRTLCHAKASRMKRECASCGANFTPKRSTGQYCSATCRQRARRQRQAAATLRDATERGAPC